MEILGALVCKSMLVFIENVTYTKDTLFCFIHSSHLEYDWYESSRLGGNM